MKVIKTRETLSATWRAIAGEMLNVEYNQTMFEDGKLLPAPWRKDHIAITPAPNVEVSFVATTPIIYTNYPDRSTMQQELISAIYDLEQILAPMKPTHPPTVTSVGIHVVEYSRDMPTRRISAYSHARPNTIAWQILACENAWATDAKIVFDHCDVLQAAHGARIESLDVSVLRFGPMFTDITIQVRTQISAEHNVRCNLLAKRVFAIKKLGRPVYDGAALTSTRVPIPNICGTCNSLLVGRNYVLRGNINFGDPKAIMPQCVMCAHFTDYESTHLSWQHMFVVDFGGDVSQLIDTADESLRDILCQMLQHGIQERDQCALIGDYLAIPDKDHLYSLKEMHGAKKICLYSNCHL